MPEPTAGGQCNLAKMRDDRAKSSVKKVQVDVDGIGIAVIMGVHNDCPGTTKLMHERDAHASVRDKPRSGSSEGSRERRLRLEVVLGMKRRAGREQMHSLTRIDHDDAFPMVNDPRVCGEPFGPGPVGENGEPSRYSVPPPLDLDALDPDPAGLDGVHLHGNSF
jgi:hypothetical protein